MSPAHGIGVADSSDALFDFDMYDGLDRSATAIPQDQVQHVIHTLVPFVPIPHTTVDKGKGIAQSPLNPTSSNDDSHCNSDSFSVSSSQSYLYPLPSLPSSSYLLSPQPSPLSSLTDSEFASSPELMTPSLMTPSSSFGGRLMITDGRDAASYGETSHATMCYECKGKGRELPHTLPPLSFPQTSFDISEARSYRAAGSAAVTSISIPSPTVPDFPSISSTSSANSPIGPSFASASSELITIPTNIPGRAATPRRKAKTRVVPTTVTRVFLRRCDETVKSAASTSVSTVSLEPSLCAAVPTSGQPSPEATPRLKARSYSSPLPYNPSTAALRDDTDAEVKFEPDYFGSRLPRELQLQVLASLVALHAAEHARAIDDGTWNTAVASSREGRWVGRDRGIRELVKLSRVSRAWRVLVLDGQLFTELDLKAFTNVPPSFLVQLAQAGGSFVRTLDVAGYVRCTADTFFAVTDGLCGTSAFRFTRLTSVNLAGCMLLSARALHHLLMHSPSLQDICLRGLDAVTNTTCDIFGAYCTQLRKVDLGRCANMDASGIRAWCNAVLLRCGERLCLTELRVCGLKHVDDAMMAALGRAAPNLEILDLSYAHQMHNSAIDAFVASAPDVGEVDVDTVWVNAQDIGRAPAEGKLRRRLTRLRHLSLSSCILLTDIACASLAHTVPRLEFLELANIGEEMGDDGLLKLFATTPLIRRVDLEDAVDISDAVLAALTPVQDPTQPEAFRRQAGHALENLVISHAMEVSNDAISRLVNSCPRLRVLEADHTSLRSSTMKRFIEKTREGHMRNAKIVGIDCRSISENAVKNVVDVTRPRLGWRAHDARRLKYVDGRDPTFSQLQQPVQDECDEMRVVLKTYYSWQTVDAVKAAYANIHKTPMPDSTGAYTAARESAGLMRWWSPGGRRRAASIAAGNNTPSALALGDGDGCTIM